MRCKQMWKKNVWQPNVEEECVRICVSKCGCAKSVILDNVPTYGTYPDVEMMSSPRLFNKLHWGVLERVSFVSREYNKNVD